MRLPRARIANGVIWQVLTHSAGHALNFAIAEKAGIAVKTANRYPPIQQR